MLMEEPSEENAREITKKKLELEKIRDMKNKEVTFKEGDLKRNNKIIEEKNKEIKRNILSHLQE